MKKSTREVSDIPHVCFLSVIKPFFTFEYCFLQYNYFVSVDADTRKTTLPGLGKYCE